MTTPRPCREILLGALAFAVLVPATMLVSSACADARTLAPRAAAAPAAAAETSSSAADDRRYGQSRPRTPDTIRLATYNVLNLFDPHDDPALGGEHDDIRMTTTTARCTALADAICAVDADVVAFQEVESLEALRWFRDTFLPDAGYHHVVSRDVGYFRGIENAVMSRHEITDARIWAGLSLDDASRAGPGWTTPPPGQEHGLAFRRSPLMVEIQVSDEYALTLFVVHHKSGRDFDHQREAEAARIIELTRGLDGPRRNIVVLGDFNAAPWDKSVRAYLEAGFVDTLGHRITGRERDADPAEVALYVTHESKRVIDYVLLNSAAYRDLVVGSPHVHGTLTPPEHYDWRNDPHPPGYASDHYPVVVDLVPLDRP